MGAERAFVNSPQVRQLWAERTGAYSPDYYAYVGPDETSEAIRARLDGIVDRDAPILELGCGSGRHLEHLREAGYENLHGVEINDDALDVLVESYPELARDGTFYADAIENAVPEFADDRFDAVFSVEVLQHVHPDCEWVFDDVGRIAGERLLTAEIEGDDADEEGRSAEDERSNDDRRSNPGERFADPAVNYVDDLPLYYRNWREMFEERGFEQIESTAIGTETLRAFRVTD